MGHPAADVFDYADAMLQVFEDGSGFGPTRHPSLTALYAFIPSIIVILFSGYYWYDDVQADKTAMTTAGVIMQAQSRSYSYKYVVDGTEYTGYEIDKQHAVMPVGQEVQVTYRPEAPETSTLIPPFGATGSRPVLMILVAVIGLYLYLRLRRALVRRALASPYDTR